MFSTAFSQEREHAESLKLVHAFEPDASVLLPSEFGWTITKKI